MTEWRSRITGHGEEDPSQLLASPMNARVHPKYQQDVLSDVLDTVGWVQSVVVSQTTGHVLDGHLRVAMAISRNEPTVPVVYVDVDEREELLILATLDPISTLAVTDSVKLAALLESVDTDSESVQKMLDELLENAPDLSRTLRDGVPVDDPAAEWRDMPSFEHEDKMAHRSVTVYFASDDDAKDFARLIGQTLTSQTKSLWHPEQKPRQLGQYVADES